MLAAAALAAACLQLQPGAGSRHAVQVLQIEHDVHRLLGWLCTRDREGGSITLGR